MTRIPICKKKLHHHKEGSDSILKKIKNIIQIIHTSSSTSSSTNLPASEPTGSFTNLPTSSFTNLPTSSFTNLPTSEPTGSFTSLPEPTLISIIQTFSEQNKIDALNIQNQERNIKNLTYFTWSNILEKEAIDWSKNLTEFNSCVLTHHLDTARGQNLYGVYGSTISSINNAINSWVDEKNLVNNQNVTFDQIGHYLSIISPDFTQVGCGITINPIQKCLVATCNYI